MALSLPLSLPISLSLFQAREGHTETAKYLLSHGADITATDNKGESALTLASTPGMVTILKGKNVYFLT